MSQFGSRWTSMHLVAFPLTLYETASKIPTELGPDSEL